MNCLNYEVDDVYEATYYCMRGSKFISAREVRIAEKCQRKNGYTLQWYITLDQVDDRLIDAWKQQKAYGNLRVFSGIRLKLKRKIKEYLGDHHADGNAKTFRTNPLSPKSKANYQRCIRGLEEEDQEVGTDWRSLIRR